jgi:dolichol-phosphate mannosyltransferase
MTTSASETVRDATLSVVIPAFNEEANVPVIYRRLASVLEGLGLRWEIIFSVDPSIDRTEEIILELRASDPRVKMLRFSRRFGQPQATLAGMAASTGDACVVIDCDLQDPPELIPEMVQRWREGYDVVYAQRRSRKGETLVKRIVAALGYRIIRRTAEVDIPPDTGDFRLMSRRVVDNVIALDEAHGFLRGLVAVVGFPQTSVLYERAERARDQNKYNRFLGSLSIGLNGIIGFSRYPLHVISLLGMSLSFVAVLLGTVYLGLKLGGVAFPTGNPTIVIVICLFSGIQLLSLGVMGEYVGRIYDEVKRRPKWIVESTYGLDEDETGAGLNPARRTGLRETRHEDQPPPPPHQHERSVPGAR